MYALLLIDAIRWSYPHNTYAVTKFDLPTLSSHFVAGSFVAFCVALEETIANAPKMLSEVDARRAARTAVAIWKRAFQRLKAVSHVPFVDAVMRRVESTSPSEEWTDLWKEQVQDVAKRDAASFVAGRTTSLVSSGHERWIREVIRMKKRRPSDVRSALEKCERRKASLEGKYACARLV